jgi:primary-amine oxidase
MARTAAILLSLLSLLAATPATAQDVRHPLDPLSWQEYWTVLETLRADGKLDGETRFSTVTLAEPAKDVVRGWSRGQPIPRSAFAIVRQGPKTFEALIDLAARKVSSFTETTDVQPNWLRQEFGAVSDAAKKDPAFIAAMKARGITDLTFIDCFSGPPGYFGTEEQKGRRVGHLQCTDVRNARNLWTRRIEGLTVVVDLETRKVIRVVDEGAVPLPTASADYDPASLGPPREVPGPIRIEQPLGPGFELAGHEVAWQKWRFHVRPDVRVGMIISTVSYEDRDQARSVLYQGHLSEIFVPYMDPSFGWFARNFIDAGEFSSGGLTKPLIAGRDCPDTAVYMDMIVAGDNGRPGTVPRTICLFERETGDMSWRHWDGGEASSASRVKRDLVVRTAAVIGNYDYVFDWVFQQDGSITVGVGATGIVEVKTVNAQKTTTTLPPAMEAAEAGGPSAVGTAGQPPAPAQAPDAYGRFMDAGIVAVNHDHYFSFRLDMDVDGSANRLQIDQLKTKMLPADHPRRSVWVNEPMIAKTEKDGQLDMHHEPTRATMWRVLSAGKTNHVGYPTSYQLRPGMSAGTLLSADDYPRRRAGFIDHQLWVTPYSPKERFAAGDYPTLSEPGYGLPAWTRGNRSIDNTDIVLWYTVGMHHMVRAEDWPIMPVLWHSFELRPFDFFDRNPAMDLPK